MARFVWYQCPDCSGKFRHLHHPSDAPPPDRCELCGSWMSEDEPPAEVFVPQAPGIKKSAYAKSIDETYRANEAASIERADEAASILESEFAKQPRDEFDSGLLRVTQKDQIAQLRSDLKVTNMKDPSQMREGDTSVVSSPAAVAGAGFRTFGGGAAPVVPGNASFVSQFTANHTPRALQMIKAGQMGKY